MAKLVRRESGSSGSDQFWWSNEEILSNSRVWRRGYLFLSLDELHLAFSGQTLATVRYDTFCR